MIESRTGHTGWAVMAPHGGGIEPGTDLIATAIAGRTHSYYAFKGIRSTKNHELHIASKRFEEPLALRLAKHSEMILTVHGCQGSQAVIFVGGRAEKIKQNLITALRKGGFDARPSTQSALRGIHPLNLCNRGRRAKGIQLELPERTRRLLLGRSVEHRSPNIHFKNFVATVRMILDQHVY